MKFGSCELWQRQRQRQPITTTTTETKETTTAAEAAATAANTTATSAPTTTTSKPSILNVYRIENVSLKIWPWPWQITRSIILIQRLYTRVICRYDDMLRGVSFNATAYCTAVVAVLHSYMHGSCSVTAIGAKHGTYVYLCTSFPRRYYLNRILYVDGYLLLWKISHHIKFR